MLNFLQTRSDHFFCSEYHYKERVLLSHHFTKLTLSTCSTSNIAFQLELHAIQRTVSCDLNTLHVMGLYMGPTWWTHGKAKVTVSQWYSSKIVDCLQVSATTSSSLTATYSLPLIYIYRASKPGRYMASYNTYLKTTVFHA